MGNNQIPHDVTMDVDAFARLARDTFATLRQRLDEMPAMAPHDGSRPTDATRGAVRRTVRCGAVQGS